MNEHTKHGPGYEHEWSRQSDATEPENMGPTRKILRLFVSVDAADSSMVRIEDTMVSSLAPGARRVKAEQGWHNEVSLSLGEVEWLLSVLPRAAAQLRKDIDEIRESNEQERKEPAPT